MIKADVSSLSCPLPLSDHPHVMMAHGSGGRLMQRLIDDMFCIVFTDVQPHDSAVLDIPQNKVAITTDSFVIRPLFFPGGDIGSLAVNGTVNDLAMAGARPQYISVSFILEEGLSMESLWRVVLSMRAAADKSGVCIVTGDTKVVERGHGDGIYINTTGIGVLEYDRIIAPERIKPGDMVILSGDVGRHGIAVMGSREGMSFESEVKSDCAPLAESILEMLGAGVDIHCLRDATRGGVAAVLNEIAASARLHVNIMEDNIPVDPSVRGACEILGFDPLHIANEGCFVAFIAPEERDMAFEILYRHHPQATQIGTVTEEKAGIVLIETAIGGKRILDMPSGELLPRIC